MTRKPRGAAMAGLLFTLALPTAACGRANHASDQVIAWAEQQSVPAGESRELALPELLRTRSEDGLGRVASLPDGRRCVLLKRHIGWKGNFEGTLTCSAPLFPTEVSNDGEPNRISLNGLPAFEELFVREQLDPLTWRVYFDLN